VMLRVLACVCACVCNGVTMGHTEDRSVITVDDGVRVDIHVCICDVCMCVCATGYNCG